VSRIAGLLSNLALHSSLSKAGFPLDYRAVATGPFLPFIAGPDAAPQLPQTGHSCAAQQFRSPKVSRADVPAVRHARRKRRFLGSAFRWKHGLWPSRGIRSTGACSADVRIDIRVAEQGPGSLKAVAPVATERFMMGAEPAGGCLDLIEDWLHQEPIGKTIA
jgi:hypothetical protein